MVQKVINAKTKAKLRFNIIVQNLDIYYHKKYCFTNNTVAKIQTQGTIVKNPCSKELKAKKMKPGFYTEAVKSSEQDKKDKKEKRN